MATTNHVQHSNPQERNQRIQSARNSLDLMFASYSSTSVSHVPGVSEARVFVETIPEEEQTSDDKPSVSGQDKVDDDVAKPETATDLVAEYEWLREERQRLETYTLSQLSQIARQREDLTMRKSEVEATFALKEQEINRQLKLLKERTEFVEHRERQLANKEAELEMASERIQAEEEALSTLRQTQGKLQHEIEKQRVDLEHLRLKAQHLQESARAAQNELISFEKSLESRREAIEKVESAVNTRQSHLLERARIIEQSEKSLRIREQELDELEAQLRCEIELREQELVLQKKDLEELEFQLRNQDTLFDGNSDDTNHGI